MFIVKKFISLEK